MKAGKLVELMKQAVTGCVYDGRNIPMLARISVHCRVRPWIRHLDLFATVGRKGECEMDPEVEVDDVSSLAGLRVQQCASLSDHRHSVFDTYYDPI